MNRIIIALDGMDLSRAVKLAQELKDCVWGVKVNSLLFAHDPGAGACIPLLKHKGARVFADPKLYDIPQTVANSVTKLALQGADLITVDANGGPEMQRAAVEAYEEHRPPGGLGIVAALLLTSVKASHCKNYYRRTPEETVLMFAEEAADAGVYAFVCSPKELPVLHGKFRAQKRITPGVRSVGIEAHDQHRFDTPRNAVLNGADFIVVGREATLEEDPAAVCHQINKDITGNG